MDYLEEWQAAKQYLGHWREGGRVATFFHGLKRFSKLPRKLRRFKSLIAMPLTRTIFS